MKQMALDDYLRPSVSNGNRLEQALIRRWWHEVEGARGHVVWEYYLGDCFLDAMWFPEASDHGTELRGRDSTEHYPIAGAIVVLCEAKKRLTPQLIGQALVYDRFARRAGARVQSTLIFAEIALPAFVTVAEELGLKVILP